ncbi:MAG: hypothetical protein K6T16_02200 [Candidatus Pacearchaeota archaeon]|nr:hypothetical protein [Candidatus Pacearchaeota archaeon]
MERKKKRREKRFEFKYPKLTLFILIILASYFVFSNPTVQTFIFGLSNLSHLWAFIAGTLYSYGFTSPISAGFFIVLKPENLWLTGILGGVGALLSDLLIFSIVRFELMDEFASLKKTSLISGTGKAIEKVLGRKIKMFLAYLLTAIFIASPLPDEAGLIMIAGLTKINRYVFMLISFVLNTMGILVLLTL